MQSPPLEELVNLIDYCSRHLNCLLLFPCREILRKFSPLPCHGVPGHKRLKEPWFTKLLIMKSVECLEISNFSATWLQFGLLFLHGVNGYYTSFVLTLWVSLFGRVYSKIFSWNETQLLRQISSLLQDTG